MVVLEINIYVCFLMEFENLSVNCYKFLYYLDQYYYL